LNADYKKIQLQTHRGIPRLSRDPITQVMESRSSVFGVWYWNPWKFEKSDHENGL